MKRAPTTFSLVLALVAVALLLALGLAAALTTRSGLKAAGTTYARMIVATALAADELSAQSDDGSRQSLAALQKAGVSFSRGVPPPPTVRVAMMLREIGRATGEQLGDPSRVVVTQSLRSSEIWIRSAHTPGRWIVLHALSYRRQLLDSTVLIMLLAGCIALIVAALAARMLTRPLERLSRHASLLLAGDPVIQQQLRGSPREVRELARAISHAGERLHAASRERELMLAGISHDLRTPLARLQLALELGDANDPQRREAMVCDLQELDSALEQCLAFVRDGRDETPRSIDLAVLIGQLLALRAQPDEWQLTGPSSLPVTVRATLLRRAIGNLLDNAEHHGAAPFELEFGMADGMLFVRVADHGEGVPTRLLPQLGAPFQRGNQARSGSGNGLGLSIVRRAAELHGGSLQLASEPAAGFVATLRLPAP